ncbi:arylamine N-acetyltransferase family protein [Paracraurococcus ruber]|uniref:Arylamine N-acetyltransferase n=1 Tax=Paracraurococcus ruber TaxID=77675 RepID=A0ABS1D885_9PROT|nr:arylamine N-acetyltransferase [Paracraurococcus ruber]MBK1662570.1 hypothetical protein [Paracraurococcus ruber]
MTEAFDLPAYLGRIGWSGPLRPGLPLLRDLVARHAAAIPFEGIEALLGRTPALDPAALQAKLVQGGRGGWCFEQNSLLLLALRALGLAPRRLLARVRYGVPPGTPVPRTHLALQLELPEGPHLLDVGFGGLLPTAPLALRPGVVQPTPHGEFRLLQEAGGWLLQAAAGGDWLDLYLLGPEPQEPADIDAANWLVANRPGGLFTANLVASLAPPGRRLMLLNHRLTERTAGGAEQAALLEGPALGAALRDRLGIRLGPADRAALEAAMAADRPGRLAAMP